jgi:hypothetical protein
LISRHKAIAIALCALTAAQLFHAQSAFTEIDTAEKLLEEYAQPTVVGVGIFVVSGFIVSVMAFFRTTGWRAGVMVVVGLYVWSIWYPDFLHLLFKYGASNAITGVFDHARAAGTLGVALLHNVLYPLGFLIVLLAALWDFKAGVTDD